MAPTDSPDRRPEETATVDFEEARRTGINPLPVRVLQIETSSECNFRCPSCPLSMKEYDRPEKHLGPEEFRRILDAFPDVEKLELQGVGEVFLNPRIFEVIRVAVERGIRVHTFSNASKIDRDTARGIVESGLALINFSMDGADEDTFRRLRKGGTLGRYRRCVTNLIQARAALGSATPHIGIMTVLSKRNYRQVPRMLAIAEELGVDTITFTKLNAGVKEDQQDITLGPEERAELDALPTRSGRLEVIHAYTPWTKEERMNCYWPKSMAYVTVEGHVTPCCNYYDDRTLNLGNVFEQSGPEIWNGEPYKAFRRRLWNGDLPDMCSSC